jgi:hypothetical protein
MFAFMLGSPAVLAQDATPAAANPFADLELPTLDISGSAEGVEGFPEQLAAGRYHLRLTVDENVEFGSGFELVQPTGITADEFLAFAAGSESGATPEAVMAASPSADTSSDPFYTATWAGGASANAGQTAEVVLDLTPGEWIVASQGMDPIVFEATGEMPADLPEPEAAVTLTLDEYTIDVTEGELTTGSHVVRIDNTGAQPHYVAWVQGPDGFTAEQVETVLAEEADADLTGTPVYSDLDPNVDFTNVIFTGNQSTGTSQWVYVQDVQAGTHLLICFFPDISDGRPHAAHGMYTFVEIGTDAGTGNMSGGIQ